MRVGVIGHKIACCVYKHLVHRVGKDVLGRDVFQIDAVYLRADRHIFRHLRRRGDVVKLKRGILCKLGKNTALSRKLPVHSLQPALCVHLAHALYYLKKPCPARNAKAFQRRSHRKADRLFGARCIGNDKVGIKRIKPALNALNTCVE